MQLQNNSDLDPEQILNHLKQEIGERAAIPKEVIIMDEIPLTTVGKVFKPALRWDAIKRVYQEELEALGEVADSVEVEVNEDKVYGSLATLTIKAASGVSKEKIKKKVDEILAPYTIKYRLEVV